MSSILFLKEWSFSFFSLSRTYSLQQFHEGAPWSFFGAAHSRVSNRQYHVSAFQFLHALAYLLFRTLLPQYITQYSMNEANKLICKNTILTIFNNYNIQDRTKITIVSRKVCKNHGIFQIFAKIFSLVCSAVTIFYWRKDLG